MKIKRFAKALIVILVIGLLAAPLISCASKSSSAQASQNVAVQRGNISVDITAAGNLALSHTEDVPVNLFYGQSGSAGTKGTIGEVLVEAGDTVKKGQLLVTIDKDEWNTQLSNLGDSVTSAELSLTSAQAKLLSDQQTLADLQAPTGKQQTVINAEKGLLSAQQSLDDARSTEDWTGGFDTVKAALDKAKIYYNYLTGGSIASTGDLSLAIEKAKEAMNTAQTTFDNYLAGLDTPDIAIAKKNVEVAQITLATARKDLADNPQDIALEKMQVTLSQGNVAKAQKALDDVRQKLADAHGLSPEVTAPFDGFVTKVNVTGGQEVLNGTIAVTVADPNKFEAKILVSEMDIMQVGIGSNATVSLDATPGVSLSANVTQISPTATISSGVVNYSVKVEVQLPSASSSPRAASSNVTAATSSNVTGALPAPLQQAVASGRLTQQQAEDIVKNGPPTGPGNTATGRTRQALRQTATLPHNFQLRDGLTVTVNINVAQRTNVLVVPNAAVTTQGGQSSVEVVTASGTPEKRTVQIGLGDWQHTEITSGLSEGDKVMVPQATAATTTTTTRTTTTPNRGAPIPFLGR